MHAWMAYKSLTDSFEVDLSYTIEAGDWPIEVSAKGAPFVGSKKHWISELKPTIKTKYLIEDSRIAIKTIINILIKRIL